MDKPVPQLMSSSLRALDDLGHGIQATIKVFQRRAEGKTDEMMARGMEQIPTVRRIDVEENSRYHNGLLLEQLFKEDLENLV